MSSLLLVELAEGVLLVMGMDPGPYQARGTEGMDQLTNIVIIVMMGANNLQQFMITR
jgi:hypothetical protein